MVDAIYADDENFKIICSPGFPNANLRNEACPLLNAQAQACPSFLNFIQRCA